MPDLTETAATDEEKQGSAGLPIRLVCRRTGLSAHVLRVWERRHGAVEPGRTGSRHRRYSEAEVSRLSLLAQLTRQGHAIGELAQLSDETLRGLLGGGPWGASLAAVSAVPAPSSGGDWMEEALSAVRRFDEPGLESALDRAEMACGRQGALLRCVAPLAVALGEGWRAGSLTVSHEHFATACLRQWLKRAMRALGPIRAAPVLVVATPAGQVHDLGALLVGALASALGWSVRDLGADLPAAELAGAVVQLGARAVALSLVYPEDDPRLGEEILRLRQRLPPGVAIIIGGRAAPAYARDLAQAGAILPGDLEALGRALDDLRRVRPPG